MRPPVCMSSVEQHCGIVLPAAPSTQHPTIQSRTCNKQKEHSSLCVCGQHIHRVACTSSHTCAAGADNVLMAPNTRTQQVDNGGDVVRRHSHFLPTRQLFVLPVIVWRIDLVQCSISPTVIKPHYSFLTTPILLETQWTTFKQCLRLVTV